MRKSIYRKRARKTFYKFLEDYRGRYVQLSALSVELGRNYGIFVTRETIMNWLVDFGCKRVGAGVYEVPKKGSIPTAIRATIAATPENEPAQAAPEESERPA